MPLSDLTLETDKLVAKQILLDFLKSKSLNIVEEEFQKPWGGYVRIDDLDLDHFVDEFFPEFTDLKNSSYKLRPKVLIVSPNSRLSWQYHHRRAEIWKVIFGPIGVVQNSSDEPTEPSWHETGELIQHEKEVRHRLMGAGNWGVVAEIWRHTDPENPSEEDDIVRVQDDYGR